MFAPAPRKKPLRKHLQELLFFQTGKRSSQEARQASLLQRKRGLTAPWRSRLQECVRPDWCLTGLSSAIACSSELGPRTTWRRVWVRISKKLPRATAMRTLSEVRESILWILKLLFERQLQSCKERISLSVPPCWVRSFTHRGVSIGVKNVPDTVSFT